MEKSVRFKIIGDHSDEHCGCQAVADVIRDRIAAHGHIVGPKKDFDVLIVNGEGSMHHGKRSFLAKMHEIRLAQARNKQTYLINTVWDQNPRDFDDCLTRLNDFWVRGAVSTRDLENRHALEVRHYLDLSYYAPIDENAPAQDLSNQVAVTDVHADGFGFVWLGARRADPWTSIDMREMSWSSLVRSLRTAKLFITGRHHGMYAACCARIPFVPVRGNSHKIEDLLESAESPIPIADSVADVVPLAKWAAGNRAAYDDLFDWMDRQPQWAFEARTTFPSRETSLPSSKTLIERANEALHKRNYETAYPLWKELLENRGAALPYPRNACMVFFGYGDVGLGMEVLARTRLSKPQSIMFTMLLMQFARHQTLWIDRSRTARWWQHIREAAHRAEIDDSEGFRIQARKGMNMALAEHGPVFASSVSFFLACKLVQLNQHRLAFEFRRQETPADTPDWITQQEDILLGSTCRLFDPETLAVLREAQNLECWADPAFRTLVVRYRTMVDGYSNDSFRDIESHFDAFPKRRDIADLYYSALGETKNWASLEDRIGSQKPGSLTIRELEQAAYAHLPLSHFLVGNGHTDDPALRQRHRLYEEFEKGKDRLLGLLSDKTLSIAVVGNSPVELGKGQGPEIDDHDLVIRFNDFSTEPPFDRDYGKRTDILIHTYPFTMASNTQIADQNCLLVQRHAFNIFEPGDWSATIALSEAGQEIAYLPRRFYMAAAQTLHATPSAGLFLAMMLKELRGELNVRDYFGFSFVDHLSGNRKSHYFDDDRPSFIHNWRKEAEVFASLF